MNDNTNVFHNIEEHFQSVLRRLLSGEKPDLYSESVSFMFEVIAKHFYAKLPGREFHWYDGVNGLMATPRKTHQIEFTGEMWVGDDKGKQWKENFRSIVTDKTATKQGIWIVLWIGADKAEGDLRTAFGNEKEVS